MKQHIKMWHMMVLVVVVVIAWINVLIHMDSSPLMMLAVCVFGIAYFYAAFLFCEIVKGLITEFKHGSTFKEAMLAKYYLN